MEDQSWAGAVGVSAAGNFLTIFAALLVYVVRQKCAKTKCKSKCHNQWCDISLSEQTIRELPDTSHRPRKSAKGTAECPADRGSPV